MNKNAQIILDTINASTDHPTAEQVYLHLKERGTKVSMATVYNNLNRLWEENRIRKVSLEGMADRYDRTRRHDHIVCKKCGRLLDVDLGDLTAQLEEKAGISILSYDLKLLYLCEACRKNLNRKECEETET